MTKKKKKKIELCTRAETRTGASRTYVLGIRVGKGGKNLIHHSVQKTNHEICIKNIMQLKKQK